MLCFSVFDSMNCGLLALDIRRLEICLHECIVCLSSLLDRCLDEMTVYQKGEPIDGVVPLLSIQKEMHFPRHTHETSHHYPLLQDFLFFCSRTDKDAKPRNNFLQIHGFPKAAIR